MSMELHVLMASSRMPDVRQWQATIDSLSFEVKLDPSLSVDNHTGFLPVKFRGRASGFEFDLFPASEITESYPEFESKFAGCDSSANFRWGGDLTEMACALAASAALAKFSDGVWFDPYQGACFDPNAAVEQARVGFTAAGP